MKNKNRKFPSVKKKMEEFATLKQIMQQSEQSKCSLECALNVCPVLDVYKEINVI